MSAKVQTLPFASGSCNPVSSTPIPGKAATAAANFSWPSPIINDHRRKLDLAEKSSEEKTREWLESQDLTAHSPDTSFEHSPEKVTKLAVIEETDEEDDEEMTVPSVTLKSLKSLLKNNNKLKKKQSLHVRFSRIIQRKEIDDDQGSKDATNSQKKTQKILKKQSEIREDSEHNIIKGQSPRTKSEYSLRNKKNARGKKQSEKLQREKNAVQTAVTESTQNKENEKGSVLIAEQNQRRQSLRKSRSRSLGPNKSTDTANMQDTAPGTELHADTESTEDGRKAQKRKSVSQESQSEDSASGKEGHASSGSRKRVLFSHEKISLSLTDDTFSVQSPRKIAYNCPFLEDKDSMPKEGSLTQIWKSKFRAKKTRKRSITAENTQKGKRQFKEKEPGDIRRSKRTRVKPLAHWIGERLCYKSGPDLCFEIVGIEPACPAEPTHRQRNDADSEHFQFSIPLQNKENHQLKKVQIINEGQREDVECFSTLRPQDVTKDFSKYKMLDSSVAEAGLIKLASSTKKNFQESPAHYVFFILKGHALVKVHDTTQEVKPGELFQVPKGISYSIENVSKKQMVLQFVMVK